MTNTFRKTLQSTMASSFKTNGFSMRGNLFYRRREDLLQCILFERVYNTAFNCEVNIQPLYIPSSRLILTFGDRLGWFFNERDTQWNIPADSKQLIQVMEQIIKIIEDYVFPWFDQLSTSHELFQWYYSQPRHRGIRNYRGSYDLNMKDDLGFVAARCQETEIAIQLITESILMQNKKRKQELEVVSPSSQLLSALNSSQNDVLQLLQTWSSQTISSLSSKEKLVLL